MLRRRANRDAAVRTESNEATSKLKLLLVALAGAASVFSFAPFGWWPLQFACLGYLFYQVGIRTAVRRSTLLGWAFGFGWSVAGMHWLYITMNRFGNIPGPLAVAAVILLGAYMGLFTAFATGVSTWLRRRFSLPLASFLFLILPFAWGLSEWMRGWVLTGFPWVAAGYAHNISPLKGYAPLVGVYGIGVIAAVCASALAMLTQSRRLVGAAVLGTTLAIGFGLTFVQWTQPQGKPISVRLVQGNIPQDQKFDVNHAVATLELYQKLVTEAPADLIALPETAVMTLPQYLPPGYLDSFKQYAAASGSHILFGIPLSDGPGLYSNSVAGYSPAGSDYRYDKHHLVPFGEFVPLGFRWFVDMMRIPLGEQTRGKEVQAPFAVKDQLVLPNVCYEDVFGEEIALQLRSLPQPATMLLNVSNLAWFGESIAIPQHLQISQMRSIETGRPMLRSTNTGATAVIDGRGQVAALLPMYAQGTLAVRVQGMGGMTPFIRFGNYTMLVLALLAFAASLIWAKKTRKS